MHNHICLSGLCLDSWFILEHDDFASVVTDSLQDSAGKSGASLSFIEILSWEFHQEVEKQEASSFSLLSPVLIYR